MACRCAPGSSRVPRPTSPPCRRSKMICARCGLAVSCSSAMPGCIRGPTSTSWPRVPAATSWPRRSGGRVKVIRDEVLSHPGRYADITPTLRAKEVVLGKGERRRRYILCLNEEEADKQRWHRAEVLEIELASLKKDHPKAACRLLASKRFGPYLSQDDHGRPYLDQGKIRRAEQLDGKFVLTTNDDTLSVTDIALGYKGMWIIESCFRKMKTTGLEVRPMFHWMPHRIMAHIKLCVLALMIQRAAEIATGLPWRQLASLLERLKAVRYTSEGQTILQATMIQPELVEVFKKLGISAPKTILAVG